MESNTNSVSIPPAEDLVEEKKPTSLLIAQFFLFPLIIIGICVGIFLLFGYLTYEQRNPQDFLNEIRAGSETRRWQAAYELSNIISTDKEKIRDTDFINNVVAVYRSSREELKLADASDHQDPRIRRFLALTMGHMGDKRAVPALVEGLDDPDLESRIYTLWALGMIGDNAAVPGILAELKNDDPAIRKTAAYVLGIIKDPSAIHDLQVALNDSKDEVRWNAAMALAQLNDASGSDLLLKLIDRSHIAMLEGMTDEQKSELMVNAVKCLGILKFEAAHDKIATLSQSDPDLAVRDASLEVLKKF
jgi:HEAT repeat protein